LKTAYLIRDYAGIDCTMGILLFEGEVFQTLEPPWKMNARNVSCIPSGSYRCEFMARSASGKYRNVYHVQRVGGRSGILAHNGNVARHTLGCILLGTRRGWLNRQRAVLNSRSAMRKFVKLANKEDIEIVIIGEQVL